MPAPLHSPFAFVRRAVVLLLAVGCSDGWDTDQPQRIVIPTFEQYSFVCVDGVASVDLPEGTPVLMQIHGGKDYGEGFYGYWYYTDVPTFTPGETLEIPCEEDQDFGYVNYAYE